MCFQILTSAAVYLKNRKGALPLRCICWRIHDQAARVELQDAWVLAMLQLSWDPSEAAFTLWTRPRVQMCTARFGTMHNAQTPPSLE
jgi:hypothetical protein